MMGNILTYIWGKFSSLFSLFGFGRDETDEGTLTIVKTEAEVDLCRQGTRSRNREVFGQSHEKTLSKIPKDKYAYMVERLATRNGLSENLTRQMLQLAENDIPCGEHPLQDDSYSVVVVKRESDFDVRLIQASINYRS